MSMITIEHTYNPSLSRFPLPDEVFAQNVEVTREVALDWLTHRVHPQNRRISVNRAERFIRDKIDTGKLVPNHPQGLITDRQGFIVDGQHRLLAVVMADITLIVQIIGETDFDQVFPHLDDAARRTLASYVKGSNADLIAAAVRYIHPVVDGLTPDHWHSTTYSGKMSLDRGKELVQDWSKELQFWGSKRARFLAPNIKPSLITALSAMAHRAGGDVYRIELFSHGLHTGEGLGADDPRRALIFRYSNGRVSNTTEGKALKVNYAYTVLSFNAHMDGVNMNPRQLVFNPSSAVPEPWGAEALKPKE